ncbi:nucleoside recognition domain-containing protein [Bacillus sp. DNRA2]|uniref:nucleoside recognition domain-containing protein n=1 Tax=Bacillus sp. DNRA2 TaxID=2723053 RepID=UPI0032B79865
METSLTNLLQLASELSTEDMRDRFVEVIFHKSKQLTNEIVIYKGQRVDTKSEKLDAIFTSPIWGFPIMLSMLGVLFYLTIAGANVPSSLLAQFFGWVEGYISLALTSIGTPDWVNGLFVLGFYRGTTWVISVMLPPMAIFFPAFALLENYGYLPRVAFNLDRLFKRVGAHGKQSLTMAMGFGCNAAAVMSTRIIESPRERMLAIITNNFVPCNGRWGTLIILSSLFMAAGFTGGASVLVTTSVVVAMVLFGIFVTFVVSWILSKTLLKGVPSHYTLELPPYRKPKIFDTVIRASLNRSLSVLVRAVKVAAPAGILTWVLANIDVGGQSLILYMVNFLDPFGQALGLDGYIMMAFILGLPANEIVLPILLMGYLSTGAMIEVDGISDLKQIFIEHGWTWLTALNMMLFSLLHFPCGTTLINVYKETKNLKWTFASFLIPTIIAILVTFLIAETAKIFGWV